VDSDRERREAELRREAALGRVAGFPPGMRGTGEHRVERASHTRQQGQHLAAAALPFDHLLKAAHLPFKAAQAVENSGLFLAWNLVKLVYVKC
jgi:hypothetical protein